MCSYTGNSVGNAVPKLPEGMQGIHMKMPEVYSSRALWRENGAFSADMPWHALAYIRK